MLKNVPGAMFMKSTEVLGEVVYVGEAHTKIPNYF